MMRYQALIELLRSTLTLPNKWYQTGNGGWAQRTRTVEDVRETEYEMARLKLQQMEEG